MTNQDTLTAASELRSHLTSTQIVKRATNFMKRAIKDQTPGSFTSRGGDDANFAAMHRAAAKLGFAGSQNWYSDTAAFCLALVNPATPSLAPVQADLRAAQAAWAKRMAAIKAEREALFVAPGDH